MYAEISNPMDYKVALYIRLSKEDEQKHSHENESQSVLNQRSMLLDYVQRQRLNVIDEYIDDGWSGGNFDRPDFTRLIGDIEAKRINMVITKDMSRLGRDYIQTGYYMEKYFPEKRVRYISLLDGVDTGVDSSINDITPFKAIINDMYAKDISKKVKSVKHDKQRKGQFIGGKAAYGYVLSPKDKNTLIVDEVAAEVVRLIFSLALSGKSCREIAVTLNEQKIPPPAVYANMTIPVKGAYSGLWSSERVTFTLKNQIYIGNMVQGRMKKVNYKSKKCVRLPSEQWIVVEATHPPLVDRAVFDKVQLLIASRNHTRARTHDYLLKGMIFCKECGYPLGVINRTLAGGVDTLYFVCRTYQRFTKARLCTCHCVRVDTVTDMVINQIRSLCARYLNRQTLSAAAESALSSQANRGEGGLESERLLSRIDAITANMDRLYTDRLDGILDESDFQRIYARLKDERVLLRARYDSLVKRAEKKEQSAFDVDELIKRFSDSFETNRELICGLVEKIELTEDKRILIHFRFRELEACQLQ